MPKPKTDKEWQERNPEKVKKYVQKYLEGKERVNLILHKDTLAKIDKVKTAEQKYSDWVRNLIKDWEKTQDTL